MSVIEKFTTSSVTPRERLDFWNRISAETFAGLAIDAPNAAFAGKMSRWHLGELTLIRPVSQAAIVRRWKDGTGPRPDRIIFHLQHRGSCLNGQWGREAPLDSGDFALVHCGDPYFTELSTLNEMLVVEMPREALASRLPDVESHLCKTIPGTSPGSRLVHDFLLSLWRQGDQSGADPDWQQGVANVFLDLVAVAVKGAATGTGLPVGMRERIIAIVENRLHAPALRTGLIAAELGVSLRTIQNAFAAMGSTPSAYILDRRLAQAADRLAAAPGESITEIAFELGFNDSAYFARCFRQRYGMTPSQWRERH